LAGSLGLSCEMEPKQAERQFNNLD
jgi:hypothetical protein